MAWNGSRKDVNKLSSRRDARMMTSIGRGLLGGALVVAISLCVSYKIFSSKGVSPHVVDSVDTELIPQVEQADGINDSAIASRDTKVGKAVERQKELPPQRPGEVRDGWLMFANGEKKRVSGVITSRCEAVTLADKTFKCFSDRCIATLLTTEFGTGFLGSSDELFSEFDQQFEESLSEDIVIDPEDSNEVKILKQAIIDTRKDLIERKKAGESLAQVMIDTRDQLIELATYREDLEIQIDRLMADNDFSEEDQEEMLKAANTMLEDRGIKPFELPSVAKQYMIINANDRRE